MTSVPQLLLSCVEASLIRVVWVEAHLQLVHRHSPPTTIVGRRTHTQRSSTSSSRRSLLGSGNILVNLRVKQLDQKAVHVQGAGNQMVLPKQRVIRSAMLVLPLPG